MLCASLLAPLGARAAEPSLPACGGLKVTLEEVPTWAFWSRRRNIELRVEGTSRPVEVVVRNVTPESLRLEGGPEQRVKTTGGSPNRVRLHATVIAHQGRLAAEPICDDSIPDAEQLSRQIARAVETVEAEIDGLAASVSATLTVQEVLALLDGFERRLLEELDGLGLAPLRAWIEDWTDEERGRWRIPVTGPPPGRSGIAFASGPRDPDPVGLGSRLAARYLRFAQLESCGMGCLLERFRGLLDVLGAVASDPTIDLCVRSTPSRADVAIRPKRYPEGRSETTDTDFLNLTRGIWVGTVAWKGETAVFEIDLISDTRNVLDCTRARARCHRQARPDRFECDRGRGD